jgi:catechol 2,3-dioxygenase-like lactoylglutathione lyase family enzyme
MATGRPDGDPVAWMAGARHPPPERDPEDVMTIRLDHANLAVRDLDGVLRFLTTAFPEFRVRGEGTGWGGSRWVHVGTDQVYLALHQASAEAAEPFVPYAGKPGTNHLGFEVEDAAAVRARLAAAGYRESTVPNEHPWRVRVYFLDAEGHDWEFVQYRSDDPRERNDYAVPDRV